MLRVVSFNGYCDGCHGRGLEPATLSFWYEDLLVPANIKQGDPVKGWQTCLHLYGAVSSHIRELVAEADPHIKYRQLDLHWDHSKARDAVEHTLRYLDMNRRAKTGELL
jgi:hypothetical protein